MKNFKHFGIIFSILFISGLLQTGSAQQCNLRSSGKETVRLEMLSEDGTNGAGITWNPERGYYYCAMAGNVSYPVEVFNAKGSSLFNGEAGFDYRGIWFNPKTGAIEGNGFKEFGYWQSDMDNKGFPKGTGISLSEGMNQPGDHTCGAFDSKKQKIYFLGSGLMVYTATRAGKMSKKAIQLKDCPAGEEDINSTSMIFTACKGKELGILDYNQKKVYFFSTKGKFAGEVALPENATCGEAFGFSYANDMVFIFDRENRLWTGYSICQ